MHTAVSVKEPRSVYSSRDIILLMKSRRMGLACERLKTTYKILVGKPQRTLPHGRPRTGWQDNVKMDLRELGRDSVD
jgi:hypothetical protein